MPELVTVIIPAHNRLELLAEAVRCVAWQTYRPIELIVVDDGSDEPVDKVVRDGCAGAGLDVVILKQAHSGVGTARQTGLQSSRGTYVQYLDSDDILLPSKIEKQVAALEAEPDAIMTYCTTPVVDWQGRVRGNYRLSDRAFDRILPQILIERPWGTVSCLWRFERDRPQPVWAPHFTEDWRHDALAGLEGRPIIHLKEPLAVVRKFERGHIGNWAFGTPEGRRTLLENSSQLREVRECLYRAGHVDPKWRAALADRLFFSGIRLLAAGEEAKGLEDLRLAATTAPSLKLRLEARLAWPLMCAVRRIRGGTGFYAVLRLHRLLWSPEVHRNRGIM